MEKSPFYLILGLGRTGISTARFLASQDIPFYVWDDNPQQRIHAESQKLLLKDPLGSDFPWKKITGIILSPGIPHHYPIPHPVLQAAKKWANDQEQPLEIISDLELYIRMNPTHQYIAVTGTNGKSTTTALLGHLLTYAQIPTAIGANFGIPVFDLPDFGEEGIYVFEVSSYQLETTPSLAPLISILLNITPDHLERHGGWEGYKAAKEKVFTSQSKTFPIAVIGVDTDATEEIFQKLKKKNHPKIISVSMRENEGDIFKREDGLWIKEEKEERFIFNLKDLLTLKGVHNAQNVAVAFATMKSLGIDEKIIIEGLKTFPGLVHRQEVIGKFFGITFINDSKATNVEATAKALEVYDNIYWILGGQAKGDDLLDLKKYFPKIKRVFLIGEAQDAFAKKLEGYVEFEKCNTLEVATLKAFNWAKQDMKENGIEFPHVLLSPACASWDQFKSFEERGEKFKEYVQKLNL
ncbi:MAG: UDP-N-acetylmuramoyl-L-alanine--D-glutamate ligase [Proteobacteria bacterium]|nr:UDP-N-acetylmuramoyl-L-alanine--D-glutamate ligase [Pseudomonadota bacterium]